MLMDSRLILAATIYSVSQNHISSLLTPVKNTKTKFERFVEFRKDWVIYLLSVIIKVIREKNCATQKVMIRHIYRRQKKRLIHGLVSETVQACFNPVKKALYQPNYIL